MKQIPSPVTLTPLFVTEIYRTEFAGTALDPLITRLEQECRRFAAEDTAGREWSRTQGYLGYTSYDSIDDPGETSPAFAELRDVLDVHVAIYARMLEMDLRGGKLTLTRLWINLLEPGGAHAGHLHPHSVCSGTLYISVPPQTSALRLEDPRHPMMMHAPFRATTRQDRQSHVHLAPTRGSLLLWESWLRHEVPTNLASEDRISISFNYNLPT